MKRTLLQAAVLLPVLLICFTVYSQTHTAKVIHVSGIGNVGFYEFKPANYGNQLHPLIIFLHGAGEIGAGTIGTELDKLLNAGVPRLIHAGATMTFGSNSFVVLSPQTPNNFNAGGGGSWWIVPAILQYAKDSLHIDTNRIYVTGLSMGGGGAWEAAQYDPAIAAQFAAAAPISAIDPTPDTSWCTIASLHIPLWVFHNDNDPTVDSYTPLRILPKILACSPGIDTAPKTTYYASNSHDAWDNAYDTGHHTYTLSTDPNFVSNSNQGSLNLYEWFLQHHRGTVNQPPTANAGANQTISSPTSQATLSGSGTAVAPATISSYSWTLVSGPSSDTPVIVSPSSASTTVTGLTGPGTHVFRLTVTDSHGLTGSATTNVLVTDDHPYVSAGNSQSINLPVSSVTLSGADSAKGGHAITSVMWSLLSGVGGSTITSPSSLSTTVTGLVQGTYVFQLSVTDDHGLTSAATMVVFVNAAVPGVLGYLVHTGAPIGDCGDTSSTGRFAIYGDSLSNGTRVYTDSARTTAYDGGFDWHEFAATLHGPVLHDLDVYPDGSVHNLSNCPGVTSSASNGAAVLGYIIVTTGPGGDCGDTTTAGRTAIYGDSVADGVVLSPDPQRVNPLDGGYGWYGFSPTLQGPITQYFSVYADGSLHSPQTCPMGSQTVPGAAFGTAGVFLNTDMTTALVVYPNPARDQVNIHIAGSVNGRVMTRISNAAGKIVLTHMGDKNGSTIDLSFPVTGLARGLYLVEISIDGKVIQRQKILKW